MPNDFREGPVTDDPSADVQRSPTRWRTVTWGVWRVTRDTAENLVDAALGEGDDATYIAEAVSWSTRSGTPETRGPSMRAEHVRCFSVCRHARYPGLIPAAVASATAAASRGMAPLPRGLTVIRTPGGLATRKRAPGATT